MKLFVWNDPYDVDYGGSCLFVVAETEEQARDLAPAAEVSQFGYEAGGSLPQKMKLGPPTWVRELPCAVIYHWSE